jgi:Tol biopolymer transport system component
MSFSYRLGLLALATTLSAGVANAGEVRFEGEGHAFNPVFSLDGKHIAFEVNRYAGDIDMFVSQIAGDIAKDAHKVALPGGSSAFGGGNQVVVNPTWHPQGVVVFEGSNQGGTYRLYYHQPGGGAAAEMISNQEIPGHLTFPTVSADGSSMAFIAKATGNGDVRTRDTNTGSFGQVTSSQESEMFPMFIGGNRLLYSRKVNNTEDVFFVGTDGSGDTAVAGGGGDQTRPTMGADDSFVFFDSSRGTDVWDIVAVQGAGGSKRVLAKAVRLPLRSRPAVSPDGQWVAYSFDDPSQQDMVMLAKIDGSQTIEIPTDFKACGEPAFGKQGDRTLLAYTALPQSGSDWRFLMVLDVSSKL